MKTIKMKDSGIKWIGEIPENIQLKRIKFLVDYTKGQKPDVMNTDCIGMPYIGASEMAGAVPTNYTSDKIPICTPKDILVLWDGAKAGLIATNMNGAVASTVVKLTVKDEGVFPKYLFYLLKYGETYFKDKVNGTTIPHMSYDYIDDIPFISFEISVQQKIADFLDEKCADIDKLIANQQGQIEKLKEYKQAIITQAVTKGLNPSAPMKDSGVEWIGEIPEGWKVCRLKNLPDYSLKDAFVDGDWIESPNITNEGIRYLTTGNIGDGIFREQGNSYISEETFKRLNCKYAYPNDLVISRLNSPYGRSCLLPCDEDKYVLAVDIVILRTRNNKKYICYFTQCPKYQHSVEDLARGTAMKRISRSNLGNIVFLCPPIEEQQQIADYLDNKCEHIDKLISIKQAKIEKLNEYKKSLIYEYVTGKKEVV